MSSLNKVQIIGNVGQDPDVRTFQNGGKVCNLSVATSERWKDKATGEQRERTEWHRVAIFAEHAANFAEQYVRKGSRVYIEGKLETRKWQDQSGQDRYSTEIVIRPYGGEIIGLDKAPADRGQGGQRQGDRNDGAGYREGRDGGGYGGGQGGYNAPAPGSSDMDDEIPF